MIENQRDRQRPIVCGTDFSATALEAIEIGAGFAKLLNTKLMLIHVTAFRGLSAVDPPLFHAALEQERVELDREAARLREKSINVESEFRTGSPFDELVTAAIEGNAQLIVLGAVGHGVGRRLVVGSVAERTAETSPVPTLVVRPKGRLQSWMRGEHPLKILIGYDFSPAGDAALRWLSQLRTLGPCDINVVHLDWPPEAATRLGYKGPLPLTENPAEIQAALKGELEERVGKFLPPNAVTLTVSPAWGTPEGSLFEISHEQNVDLVVVGTHQRAGLGRVRFGSVSRSVLHHSKVSVAVIPPLEEAGAEMA